MQLSGHATAPHGTMATVINVERMAVGQEDRATSILTEAATWLAGTRRPPPQSVLP